MHTQRESHRKQFNWLALGLTTSLALAACSTDNSEPPNKMVPTAAAEKPDQTEPEPVEVEEEPPASLEDEVTYWNSDDGSTTTRYSYVWDEEVGDYVLSEVETLEEEGPAPLPEHISDELNAFADRQQMPQDAGFYSAVTEEQAELVEYVRGQKLAQGGKFDEFDEHLVLELGLEGCMASIIYGHEISRSTFEDYVATSESIQFGLMTSVGDPQSAEQNLVNLMTIGLHYLCPADHDSWRVHYLEKYEQETP